MNNNIIPWIFKTTIITLSSVVISVVLILLIGLFDSKVDNDKIFEIIGPAFNTIVGAFVGLIGGLTINKNSKDCNKDESK